MSKNKYIIAVCGTQNTGKSTFIRDLIEKYSNDPVISQFKTSEVDYRKKIEACGLKINRNGNLQSQKIIFDCLSEAVVNAIEDNSIDNFVSDRCPLDCYCYTVYLQRHNSSLGITEDDLEDMYLKLKYYIRLYDEIFYIDLDNCDNVIVVDDKFRDTDIEYRKEIDLIFKETMNRLKKDSDVKFNDDIHGSRTERLNKFNELRLDRLAKKIIH